MGSVGVFAEPTPNAQIPTLSLEAESVEFAQNNGEIHASGDVVVTYGSQSLLAPEMILSPPFTQVVFPKGFSTSFVGADVSANTMSLNYSTYLGKAAGLSARIERSQVSGEVIEITPDVVDIWGATFTTCTESNPHYLVKSGHLRFFPLLGVIVAFDDVLSLYGIPVFYFPTYVFASRQYSILGSSSPIPDIGSNAIEGVYLKERLGYFLDRQSVGSLGFGYMGTGGFFVGLQNTTSFLSHSSVQIRFQVLEKLPYEGGFRYDYQLEERKPPTAAVNLEDIVNVDWSTLDIDKFSLELTEREIVNNTRVSFLPMLSFGLTKLPVPFLQGSLTQSISIGSVLEENPTSSVNSGRALFNTVIQKDFLPSQNLTGSLRYFGSWYEHIQTWQRAFLEIGSKIRVGNIAVGAGHSYILFNCRNGPSPFDLPNQLVSNEVFSTLTADFEMMSILLANHYDLDFGRFRTFDVGIRWNIHCWYALLSWHAQQGAISLSAGLI